MKTISVKRSPRQGTHLSEIYHSGWEVGFVSSKENGYTFATQLAFCKDFLNDAVWAAVNNKPVSIYSFCYDPEVDSPIDMKTCRIGVRHTPYSKNKDLYEGCLKSARLMRTFERKWNFKKKTTVLKTENNENIKGDIVVFESDPRWMSSTVLLSLYTCLARMGLSWDGKGKTIPFVKEGKVDSRDREWLTPAVSSKALDYLLENGTKCFSEDMKGNYNIKDSYEIHNLGIQAYGYAFQLASSKKAYSSTLGWKWP